MGEFHFSRYPRQQWEESILKMKAAGIDVIATYVFWIYHEEEEGKFNWADNNDLKAFIQLCKKHQMKAFVRIGPWCHGEVRNGGFPDWIVKRGNTRKNNPDYLKSVQKLYNEIGRQLSGLYFKDGGPIIGAQIENEYRFNNPAGLEHILTLKKMSIEAGIDVPFYTATGWPGSNQKQDELVPVWGAYPEAPWDKRTTPLPLSVNYLFGSLRNDPAIGSDLFIQDETADFKGYRYPYATAEMGGGNQITYHRRPIITSDDVTALAYTKVGSGANLMGYYMFHGGSNPFGKHSTLQESKATNYPNDYPIISYDFLSPIGEWGQIRPSYRGFKTLHTFLNEFGDKLVNYYAAFPDKKPSGAEDSNTLRMSVRSAKNSGFVFVSNVQRQLQMEAVKDVVFDLRLVGGENLRFPQKPIIIKSNVQAIFPFNMDLDGLSLKYATAQPFCRLEGAIPTYIFFSPEGIEPEFVFGKAGVTNVQVWKASVRNSGQTYRVDNIKSGADCGIELELENQKKIKILVLNHQQIADAWKVNAFGAERLFISKQDLIFPEGKLRIQSTGDNVMKLEVYPSLDNLSFSGKASVQKANAGVFTSYSITLPEKSLPINFKEVADIAKYQNNGTKLPLDDRNSKNTPASPGPQYQSNLLPVQDSKYFEITVPKDALKNLSDAFLSINYYGDTGAAYLDGKLIADDFYSGPEMKIGLKRFGQAIAGKKILFQIVPLTDERQIFFERGVREPLKGKTAAGLNSVKLLPQYEVEVKLGK